MRGSDDRRTSRARTLRRAETEAEHKLWLHIRNRRIASCKFVRQEPIGPYFADFACRERRLVLEVDGSQHADSTRDKIRDAYLLSQGYRVLRFWNGDVLTETESVLDTIYAALTEDPETSEKPLPASGERSSRRQPTG